MALLFCFKLLYNSTLKSLLKVNSRVLEVLPAMRSLGGAAGRTGSSGSSQNLSKRLRKTRKTRFEDENRRKPSNFVEFRPQIGSARARCASPAARRCRERCPAPSRRAKRAADAERLAPNASKRLFLRLITLIRK